MIRNAFLVSLLNFCMCLTILRLSIYIPLFQEFDAGQGVGGDEGERCKKLYVSIDNSGMEEYAGAPLSCIKICHEYLAE